MPSVNKEPADYILPLYMNGLSGRVIRLPAPPEKKREILFIYGHHASLERIFGVAEYLNRYGAVTVPDLPGFGGMDSFYKIGEKPTLDNFADYLASYIKLRYKKKRFTIGGLSLGFTIITRMLQKYPEIAKQVELLGSFAGMTHRDDFTFSRTRYWAYRLGTRVLSGRIPSLFFKHVILRPIFIRGVYKYTFNAKQKFEDTSVDELKRLMDMEVQLWQCNDQRTYMDIAHTMFKLDLTHQHVDLPVYHVAVDTDRYFDNTVVEQHMRTIYKDFHLLKARVPNHSPSVIATAEEAAFFFPAELRRLFNKKV